MYASALPRLEAEEALADVRRIAAGTGHMEKDEWKEYVDGLEDIASGGWKRKQFTRPQSAAEFEALAADIGGFRVIIEDPEEPDA